VSFGGVAPGQTLPVDIGQLHYQEIAIQPIYHHTPVDVAEAVRQLIAGEVPVEHLITARLPMSELKTALQMVADRTTLRTILVPDPLTACAQAPGTPPRSRQRGERAAGQRN
jgi:threonine dehydrogenase-like Zn-dependent dehydrogenase